MGVLWLLGIVSQYVHISSEINQDESEGTMVVGGEQLAHSEIAATSNQHGTSIGEHQGPA